MTADEKIAGFRTWLSRESKRILLRRHKSTKLLAGEVVKFDTLRSMTCGRNAANTIRVTTKVWSMTNAGLPVVTAQMEQADFFEQKSQNQIGNDYSDSQTKSKYLCDMSQTRFKNMKSSKITKELLPPTSMPEQHQDSVIGNQYGRGPSVITEDQWQINGINTPVDHQSKEFRSPN